MKLHQIFIKNSFWNISSYLYLLLAAIISLPLTLIGLGVENYARYLVITGLAAIFISLDLGIPASLIRSLAREKQNNQLSLFQNSLTLALIFGFIAGLLGCLALYLTNQTAVFSLNMTLYYDLAKILGLYIFVNYLISLFAAVPQGKEDFAVYSIRAFVGGTGNTFIAAAAALATHDLNTTLWMQTYSSLFTLFLLALYLVSQYGFSALIPSWQISIVKSLLAFGFPLQIGNLAPQLQANLSKVISSNFLAVNALTGLGIAQSLTFKGIGLFGQISSVFFPTASRLASNNKRLKKLAFRLSLLFSLLAIIASGIIYYWGQPLLTWWLRDQNLTELVTKLLLYYSFFVLVLAPAPFIGTLLNAAGKPWLVSLYSWGEVILEIILLVIGIRYFGVTAVPLAAMIAQGIITPLFLIKTAKELK